MSSNKKAYTLDPFQEWSHRFGRIGMILFFLYMLMMPVTIGFIYNCFPSLSVLFAACVGVILTFVPIGVAEAISYSPILGSSTYLAFLTGNIMNLKMPCAVNAMEVAEVDQGTPEGDAVSAMAVAASSIMTIIVIAFGVLLIVPLQPILTWPPVAVATQFMLPALFGSFFVGMFAKEKGEYQINGKLKGAVIPIILISIGFVTGVLPQSLPGICILLILPVVILCSWILFKKGQITVDKNPNYVPIIKEKSE